MAVIDHGRDRHAALELFQFGAARAFAAIQQENVRTVGVDQGFEVGGAMQHGGLESGAADGRGGVLAAIEREDRTNAFAVAQGARQRHHALDMAIAELAAAIAADQRQPA